MIEDNLSDQLENGHDEIIIHHGFENPNPIHNINANDPAILSVDQDQGYDPSCNGIFCAF